MLHSRIFTFNPIGTNCTVLWEDGQQACTVVDPGMSSDDGVQQLADFFKDHGLTPDAIFLTHGHFDHVWGVEKLLKLYPVPVYMHPADKDILADGSSVFSGGMQKFKVFQHNIVTKDVAEGDVLTSAGTAWKVIHTPGHTPGGVCYYSAENNLLLSGDTLFAGSIGRTDFESGNAEEMQESLERMMWLFGDGVTVYPGHDQKTTIAKERETNPYLR